MYQKVVCKWNRDKRREEEAKKRKTGEQLPPPFYTPIPYKSNLKPRPPLLPPFLFHPIKGIHAQKHRASDLWQYKVMQGQWLERIPFQVLETSKP
jgi:hypothetical protein